MFVDGIEMEAVETMKTPTTQMGPATTASHLIFLLVKNGVDEKLRKPQPWSGSVTLLRLEV